MNRINCKVARDWLRASWNDALDNQFRPVITGENRFSVIESLRRSAQPVGCSSSDAVVDEVSTSFNRCFVLRIVSYEE